MNIRPFLIKHLSGLVGLRVVRDRFYAGFAPQGSVLPFVILQGVAGHHRHHLGGRCGVDSLVYQVDVYGSSNSEAWTLANVVEAETDQQRLRVTVGTDTCEVVPHLSSKIEHFGSVDKGGESRSYRITQTYKIVVINNK